MSDTPRTDKKTWHAECGILSFDPVEVVDADFAREIERELNRYKSRVDWLMRQAQKRETPWELEGYWHLNRLTFSTVEELDKLMEENNT